jgi:hypothetical protein
LRVVRTRASILLASRYFWTARMILMAQYRPLSRSKHSTTFPNVPCPRSRIILSRVENQRRKVNTSQPIMLHCFLPYRIECCNEDFPKHKRDIPLRLTSRCEIIVWGNNIVPFLVVPRRYINRDLLLKE